MKSPSHLRPVPVESEQQSRLDPALAAALKRAVAAAIATRPVAAVVLWETADGTLDWRAIPDSPSLVEGLARRFYGLVRTDDE